VDNLLFLKPIPIKGKTRLGPKHDSGYVVYKKLLDETDILITYGVGWQIEFEEEFNRITNKPVVMFDPTMHGTYLVEWRSLSKLLSNLAIIPLIKYLYFIFSWWRRLKHLNKRKVTFVNRGLSAIESKKYNTLENHILELDIAGRETLLKIDIEGNEYEVFLSESFYKSIVNVTQIIVEFHNLKNRLRDLQRIVERLSTNYYLIHIHGNNWAGTFRIYNNEVPDLIFPDTIEATFIRKDKIAVADILDHDIKYPIDGLDFPNNPRKPDYKLQFTHIPASSRFLHVTLSEVTE
jgi:hypothetical protein